MGRQGWAWGLALVFASPVAGGWGNGCANCNPGFPFYGAHDAIADGALAWLVEEAPGSAAWVQHWYRPFGGDSGASYKVTNLQPTATDNWLAYTDDPDTVLQDWSNHLYMVHPRPGHDERDAPVRVAYLHSLIVQNLTLLHVVGLPAGVVFEHNAAYLAGLMAHYVGDMSQYGHTDHTTRDHSHPVDDPQDRTFHGYYESATWNVAGLAALRDALNANPQALARVGDVAAEVVALAEWVNARDGVGLAYTDVGGGVVTVGTSYKADLDRYVAQYNANQKFQGMRGFDATLWTTTIENQRGSVLLLARLLNDALLDAEDPTNVLPLG